MSDYCGQCGVQLSEEHNYCPECGNELKNNTQSDNSKGEKEESNGHSIIGIIMIIFGIIVLLSGIGMIAQGVTKHQAHQEWQPSLMCEGTAPENPSLEEVGEYYDESCQQQENPYESGIPDIVLGILVTLFGGALVYYGSNR